jgi:hypothetical protein
MDRLTLLMMAGYPRSGTTIVGNILNELEGFVHVGESHYLWERNLLKRNRRCGCGLGMPRCPVWGLVLPGLLEQDDPASVLRWQRRSGRWWRRSRLEGMSSPGGVVGRYVEVLSRFYRRVAGVTGAGVIVDSSKWVSAATLARLVPDVDVHLLHVIRDPRGVIHSRQRKLMKERGDGSVRLSRPRAALDAWGWLRVTRTAERMVRSGGEGASTMRYEDFADHPRAVLKGILDDLGAGDPDALPFEDERHVVLGTNHTLGGNRNRFASGTVEIREDDRWRSRLRPADRKLIEAVTRPVAARYGYLGKAT